MKTLLCLLAFLILGCAGGKPSEPPPRSIQAIDQSVVATTQMNLKTDVELAGSGLTVAAENGLLVLRGTVPSDEAKARAQAIAEKSAGVAKVANHLEVAGSAP